MTSPSRSRWAGRPPSRSASRTISVRSTTAPAAVGSVVVRRSIASSTWLTPNRTAPSSDRVAGGEPRVVRIGLGGHPPLDALLPDGAQHRVVDREGPAGLDRPD